jgi:hypothetical protein
MESKGMPDTSTARCTDDGMSPLPAGTLTRSLTHPLLLRDCFVCIDTGPDIELVQDVLKQVGKRHKDFGVQKAYFPHMGEALIFALRKTLGGDAFTDTHAAAWKEVYAELSGEIVKSM